MKLKNFYRVNKNGDPVLGSNIRRYEKPISGGKWKQFKSPCCEEQPDNCVCGFKYYVQIDSKNQPVDYTLIKRLSTPKNDIIRHMRVEGISCCSTTPEDEPEVEEEEEVVEEGDGE